MENMEFINTIAKMVTDLESQVQSNPSVLILDEYKLTTINHNLNNYPNVKVLCEEYGAGIGDALDVPAGGKPVKKIGNKISYDDKDNLTVYIPKEYLGSNPIVEKISNTEYIVTFSDSVFSVILSILD